MATCGVNENVMWGSIQESSLKGESWVDQLNPHRHEFIVQGGNMFQCDGVRPWHKF